VVWWRQNERHPETYLLHAPALAAVRVYGVPGGGTMNSYKVRKFLFNLVLCLFIAWMFLCFIGTLVTK
jgi:hypothetical protein